MHISVQVFLASCEDLQIRVYCPNFTVLQGVPMPSSALCLLYLEESDELLAGGVGQLHTWALHPRQKNMLAKTTTFTTTIKPQQVHTYAHTYAHTYMLYVSTVSMNMQDCTYTYMSTDILFSTYVHTLQTAIYIVLSAGRSLIFIQLIPMAVIYTCMRGN